MNKDKVVAELFIAPEEGTLKVLGIDGYFITKPMIEFLEASEDSELYLSDVKKEIKERYGDEYAFYTIHCELDLVPAENQGMYQEFYIPEYYTIGKIIDIQQEVLYAERAPETTEST